MICIKVNDLILYFSATGNSEYIAKRISSVLDDKCVNLFDKLKNSDFSEIHSEKPFVIITPTYGWQMPHIVRDWLNNTPFSGNRNVYFVMSCGGEIGNSAKYAEKICKDKNMNFKGCAEIVMPENYIAMFDVPEKVEAVRIVDKAEPVIDETANRILNNESLKEKGAGFIGKLKSSIVNAVYYPVFLHSKQFTVSDDCISCGKCVNACVLGNIKFVNGKPQWEDNCTHCMACICGCPVEAIEYGNASKGKPRYHCPK